MQQAILDFVWANGPSTSEQIREGIRPRHPLKDSSIRTLLRRLESQGLLVSEWREEGKRNKRFYRLSPTGRSVLKDLLAEWQSINAAVNRIAGATRSVA